MVTNETGQHGRPPRPVTRGGLRDQRAGGRDIGAELRVLYEAGPLSAPLPQHILDLLVAIEAEGKRQTPAQDSVALRRLLD